ncbi:hypothetical protein DXG03_001644 [Asterophora parasitica]|uniref:Uncharacterized protein n=1 Tax=Asterophora parasitica TaxID=117018 RepID=A0A9P7G9M2_9AGAR|nr:hypothetical protein DXG03_001644 [Asterophora parasitica]
MRYTLQNVLLLSVLSLSVALASAVDCPPTDKDGGSLTGSEDKGSFVTCSYSKAGPCTYFPVDGSFSSGSSVCPVGLPQTGGGGGGVSPTTAGTPPPSETTFASSSTPLTTSEEPAPSTPPVLETIPAVTTFQEPTPTTTGTTTTDTASSSNSAPSSAPSSSAVSLSSRGALTLIGLAGTVAAVLL